MAISKLILCVSNNHLIAGVWNGSRMQTFETFENNAQGYGDFEVFVKSYQNLNAYMIADAIEEEYRLETLPHTSGGARKELLERKLNQFNRNNLFRVAHFIGQDKDKRRDDNFLFAALSNADFLQGWMAIIQANQLPLVGLYLLPMISQYAVQQMKLDAPNMLLCERLTSGLRQTYLSRGSLRMSRLAAMTDVKPNQTAYFYLTEIEKTRLYLLSQRFVTDHTEMQLVLPSLDNHSEVIGKSISQEQGLECKIVDYLAYAKNINISPDLVVKCPELLHMQLLANGFIPDSLAPQQLTKSYHLNNTRRGIYIATALTGLFGLGVAGYAIYKATDYAQQLDELQQQTAAQQMRYEMVAKDFPTTPIPSADLKVAADIADALRRYNATPSALMTIVSQALDVVPEIGLSRIYWTQTPNMAQPDIEQTTESGQSAANVTQAPESNLGELRQIAFLNAELLNFGGDYRAALTSVNRFVATLQQHPQVEQVTVLQEPVNVSSYVSLQGSTRDESTSERAPAVFKLKIVLKPYQDGGQP
jgi:hypothetical protein